LMIATSCEFSIVDSPRFQIISHHFGLPIIILANLSLTYTHYHKFYEKLCES